VSQTLAIFVDQYRALKARKMFWIVLALSGLVVAMFGAVGINDSGLTLFGASIGLEKVGARHMSPTYFYKMMFSKLGIGVWLSWLAALLALISTGGMFPEFISSGCIELTLSKPIGRIRLFLTQYLAGLLFVALQVGVFCWASFLVLGLRANVWEPWLFLAVPLVVCFFSFLFSVCAMLGVWTRSTVAAILLTLLFWFCLYVLNMGDAGLLAFRMQKEQQVAQADKELRRLQKMIRQADSAPATATGPTTTPAEGAEALRDRQKRLQQERDRNSIDAASLGEWSRKVYLVRSFLPKTTETLSLLERVMIEKADMPRVTTDNADVPHRGGGRIAKEFGSRSVAWVLGTSLAFEAVVLALACFIFCKRDY
jgi:ABC-type transport system involved in multi-copper enzyme maturation permease subunit